MQTMVFIDDEIRQCKGMKKIIERLFPQLMVETFTDPLQAAEYIQANGIRLVITDICMSDMDGLTLVKKLMGADRKRKVILLTGHAEFEYARKAISAGAYDFLLKPMKPEELQKVLEKCMKEIQQESQKAQAYWQMHHRLDEAWPAYMEHLMNQWLVGSLTEEEKEKAHQIFPQEKGGCLLLTRFFGLERWRENRGEQEYRKMKQQLGMEMKARLGKGCHSLSFFVHGRPETMVTVALPKLGCHGRQFPWEGSAEIGIHSQVLGGKGVQQPLGGLFKETGIHSQAPGSKGEQPLGEPFKEMESSGRLFCGEPFGEGFRVRMGIGESVEDVEMEKKRAYESAVQALEYAFYFPEKNIYQSGAHARVGGVPVRISVSQEEWLAEAIRGGEKAQVWERMERLLEGCLVQGYPSPHALLLEVERVIQHIAGLLAYQAQFQAADVEEEGSFADFKKLLHRYLDGFTEEMELRSEGKSGGFSIKFWEYIKEHYMEEISLDDVAAHFQLTPSYCSRLIKETTNSNFSQILIEERMKKARELLGHTQMHIYEVASSVGYRDAKYFNRVFKSATGMTPQQYRREGSRRKGR